MKTGRKADLHNHLRTRVGLKRGDFNRTLDIASIRLGPGALLGITNFADDKRYEIFLGLPGYERIELQEKTALYVPQKHVFVVKGQEIPTNQGHLLVLGLPRDVHLKDDRTLEDAIQEARDRNGIIVVDHPFYTYGAGALMVRNESYLQHIDAIEVHNGEAAFNIPFVDNPFPRSANQKALEWYKQIKSYYPHLGALAASDGHSFYEIGSSWTELEFPTMKTTDFSSALRGAIRKADISSRQNRVQSKGGLVHHVLGIIAFEMIAPKLGINVSATKDTS